jgi:hypothetical protein
MLCFSAGIASPTWELLADQMEDDNYNLKPCDRMDDVTSGILDDHQMRRLLDVALRSGFLCSRESGDQGWGWRRLILLDFTLPILC